MLLGAGGEMGEPCAEREKKCRGGDAVREALLMASDAGNCLGEKGAAWKAAVKRAWKRKACLKGEARRGD